MPRWFAGFALALLPALAAAQRLPARLSDAQFWGLVEQTSEPGGYFRSDNFVSNEVAYQWVLPELRRTVPAGGVYLGVGPEQNFTYIAALRPRMAFIVDIRRQNMLQHLVYKVLFERAADRAEFLSLLFSRPRPAGLDSTTSVDSLFNAIMIVLPDSVLYRTTLRALRDELTTKRGYALSAEDLAGVEYVFSAFYNQGPLLDYGYPNMGGRGRWPSYAQVMLESDSAGVQRSYLATEASWRVVKALQAGNLIVPVTGNFAGPRALRAVGEYLRGRGASVSAFYLSNVEQYLWRDSLDWRAFYDNVATLPVAEHATFIRSVPTFSGNFGFPQRSRGRAASMLASIPELLREHTNGGIASYFDVIRLSR